MSLGEHTYWVCICIDVVSHVINYANVSGIPPNFPDVILPIYTLTDIVSSSCPTFAVFDVIYFYSVLKPKRPGQTLFIKLPGQGSERAWQVETFVCKPEDLGSIPQFHEVARKS